MRNLFRFIGIRHIRLRPARTLLTALGILLGVALFISITIINRSTLRSFQDSVEAITGKASLTVTGGESGFPEEMLDKVLAVPGVQHAVPMVETRTYFEGDDKSIKTVMIFGIDLLKESAVRTYKTENDQIIDDPLIFLNQPDSIIVTRSFAAENAFEMDSRMDLTSAYGKKPFTIRGMLSPSGPAKAYGGGMAIMDIDGARVTFGKEGRTDRIDVVTDPALDPTTVKKGIEQALGPGYDVEAPETQADNKRRMVAAFQGLLSFLSSLALIVGIFLVANSVSVTVAERRREIGTLRALGATRRSILALILSESVFVGAVSAFLGALLGRVMAEKLVGFVVESVSLQMVTKIATPEIQFDGFDIGLAVLIGALSSAGAALMPAWNATHIQPVEALKPKGSIEQTGKQPWIWTKGPWIGFAVLIFLGIMAWFNLGRSSKILAGLSPVLGMLSIAVVAPAVVNYLVRLLRRVTGHHVPTVFLLALENLLRNPRRTGSNILSLIVGLSFVIIISAVNSSFRTTMVTWADKVMSYGRVIVSSNGRLSDFQVQPLHESVGEKLKKVEGVNVSIPKPVFSLRFVRLQYEGVQVGLKAMDDPPPDSGFNFIDAIDTTAVDAGQKLFDTKTPHVLVSQSFVTHFNKKTGDMLTLNTPSGPVVYPIGAVVSDYANANGTIYISRDVYKKTWKDPLITGFSVIPIEGYSMEQLRKNIDNTVGRTESLITTLASELVADISNLIDQSFMFTRAIEFAALAVGLLGLLNTLLISILERTRELGMLRAIGMERKQVFTMILVEALVQGALGAFVAAALGAYLSFLWISSTMQDLLGWVIYFSFPWKSVITTLILGVGVALLAGLLPSRRAAGLQIRDALEYE